MMPLEGTRLELHGIHRQFETSISARIPKHLSTLNAKDLAQFIIEIGDFISDEKNVPQGGRRKNLTPAADNICTLVAQVISQDATNKLNALANALKIKKMGPRLKSLNHRRHIRVRYSTTLVATELSGDEYIEGDEDRTFQY